MSKVQAIGRAAFLGWLGAEWVGILFAFTVANFSFAFLIGDVLIRTSSASFWWVPLVIAGPAVAVVLVWWASAIPRSLLRQAREHARGISYSATSLPLSGKTREASLGSWRTTRLTSRVSAFQTIGLGGSGPALSRGIDLSRPNETRPGVAALGPLPAVTPDPRGVPERSPTDFPTPKTGGVPGWPPRP